MSDAAHVEPILPSATRREPRGYPARSAHDISSADAGKNRTEVNPEQEPGLEVVADLSSGSSATTLLCRREGRLFYRKFVFGEDKDRLFAQTEHLIHLAQAGKDVRLVEQRSQTRSDGRMVVRDEDRDGHDAPPTRATAAVTTDADPSAAPTTGRTAEPRA